jgi:hypothetical protein
MTFRNRHLVFPLLIIALLSIGWMPVPVDETVSEGGAPSYLIIEPLPVHSVGQRVSVNVELVNAAGIGVPNKPIILYVNGERVRRVRTADNGTAVISIGKELAVGEYLLEVEFIGTEAYRRSTANSTLIIRPLELVIETLPPIPGMRFSLNDDLVETGVDGLAHIELDTLGTYPLKVLLPEVEPSQTDTLIEFERWGDAVFQPEREVVVRGDTRLQAGFDLSHRVGQQFVDLDGGPVDDSRIDTLTLKSSYGSTHTFEDGQPQWLQANRIARRSTGLEVTPVQYSVESVIIDGTNVVNRYQQRFFLEPEDTWTIELLLYSAVVTAKDAIFGFPLGEGITVEYPNATVESLKFNADNEVYLGPLARGSYKLQVTGVGGVAPPTPVALSRDQEVVLKVLSVFDISVGLILGAMIGFGLLFHGRPQLLHLPKDIAVAAYRFSRDVLSKRGESARVGGITTVSPPHPPPAIPPPLPKTKLISKGPEVYGWHACLRKNNTQALETLDKQTRRWKVTPAYLRILDETLTQEPKEYGYDFAIWTREKLRDHLEQQTNIRISVSWLGLLLNKRGYVFRRPPQIKNNRHHHTDRGKSRVENGAANRVTYTTFERAFGD